MAAPFHPICPLHPIHTHTHKSPIAKFLSLLNNYANKFLLNTMWVCFNGANTSAIIEWKWLWPPSENTEVKIGRVDSVCLICHSTSACSAICCYRDCFGFPECTATGTEKKCSKYSLVCLALCVCISVRVQTNTSTHFDVKGDQGIASFFLKLKRYFNSLMNRSLFCI